MIEYPIGMSRKNQTLMVQFFQHIQAVNRQSGFTMY